MRKTRRSNPITKAFLLLLLLLLLLVLLLLLLLLLPVLLLLLLLLLVLLLLLLLLQLIVLLEIPLCEIQVAFARESYWETKSYAWDLHCHEVRTSKQLPQRTDCHRRSAVLRDINHKSGHVVMAVP